MQKTDMFNIDDCLGKDFKGMNYIIYPIKFYIKYDLWIN
jgi:hypothetical protein